MLPKTSFGAVLLLILAVPHPAPAQTKRAFSHRLHLRLKPDCTSCHTAATRSTKAQDNLLPGKEVCLPCHKDAVILPRAATPLNRFNHALHLKLGNIAPLLARAIDTKSYLSPPGDIRKQLEGAHACTACHRGLAQSDAVTGAALPRMADCLVCHNQIDPPDSCEFCHARGMSLKPANHSADFLDSHSRRSARLDKTSCAVCHGRKFTCLGCH